MTVFNTLNELNGKSGGLLGLAIMIAAGLLIWFVKLAIRQVSKIEDWVCRKREIAREKIALSRMTNEELAQAAIEGNVRLAYGALERLDDAALLMKVAHNARPSIAKYAAAKHCELAGHDWNCCKCRTCGEHRNEEHDWEGCQCRICGKSRDDVHDWEGCKCRICGKVRDEEHDWEGCKCRICGKVRDEEHDWEGCKCRICGKVRDAGHDWDGCKCKRCGKTRDIEHDWEGCRCQRCGKTRDAEHDWNGVVCRKCGAVKPHEHVWAYAYTDYDESCCGSCDKAKAGGVEDWCGDFCFGPGMCSIVLKTDIERCTLCGAHREKP